jgi:hypothetical protein
MNFRPFERPRGVRTVGVRKIVSFVKGLSPRFGPDLILRGRREKTDLTKVGRTFRWQAALPWWRLVALSERANLKFRSRPERRES